MKTRSYVRSAFTNASPAFRGPLVSANETVEKPVSETLMENVPPAVLSGTRPGTRPGGVGTEPERSAGKEIPRNEAYDLYGLRLEA